MVSFVGLELNQTFGQNRKNTPDRLELKKYNPFLKRVTVHREIK